MFKRITNNKIKLNILLIIKQLLDCYKKDLI